MKKPYQMTAHETVESIRRGNVTTEECVHSFFDRISDSEAQVHAYISLDKNQAIERARNIDKKLKRGSRGGKLVGVCMAVKDNICTQTFPTTCGSKMLETYTPPYNATVVDALVEQDAIIIGKSNMDEFAMGSSTETSFYGPTTNPWNPQFVPGGSSGGSAAAVAAEEAVLALGSDTGGSVRCPASFCSVVGLKPTYGLVSRYGLIAYANSLEQIGPLSRNVYDSALLLSVIAQHDRRDATSLNVEYHDYTRALSESFNGVTIGVPKEFFGEGVDTHVAKTVKTAIDVLAQFGATVVSSSLPTLRYALPAYYLIAMSEASSNLARYDGVRYGYSHLDQAEDWGTGFSKTRKRGFGPEVRRRIILGTYALSSGYYDMYYMKALKVRTLIKADFHKAFQNVDVLVGPTMPIPPFRIGEKINDPLAIYMCDLLTVPENLVGCPAISIPCGKVNGLPIGLQIIAPPLHENRLFHIASQYELATTSRA
jgi:aspartyl-tRNA(Asn)/glutamyl-tRNA(Gln) amidotransferase subunit A